MFTEWIVIFMISGIKQQTEGTGFNLNGNTSDDKKQQRNNLDKSCLLLSNTSIMMANINL